METLFFGRSDRQLLGVFHPAEGMGVRDHAVVLCYPAPQEMLRVHWSFRRLAAALAREGVAVLRFDYSGTGDSAGEAEAATLSAWCEDVVTAARELADLSGAPRVSLVGFRLGAALAHAAARAGLAVRDLVLWDPVVRGAAYLAELRQLEARRVADARVRVHRRADVEELLGFELSPTMRAQLEAVDLLAAPPAPAHRRFLFTSEPLAPYAALAQHWAAHGAPLEQRHVPEAAGGGHAATDAASLASRILQELTRTLARRAA